MKKYFEVKKVNDITVVVLLFSELSIEESEEFKMQFYKLISDTDNKFIIDISKCLFLPSVVLGIIVNFTAKVHQQYGRIVFCRPSEQVRATFAAAHLTKIFEIYGTQEEAVKSFK